MKKKSGVSGQRPESGSADAREIHRVENMTDIFDMLEKIPRDGMNDLIRWLAVSGYFTSPASTKYHGCYPGGLSSHSIMVMQTLRDMIRNAGLQISDEAIIVSSLLHDVCKVGAYIWTPDGYTWNKDQPSGHAELSITRIQKFIKLTEIEFLMISYHMGPWAHTSAELTKVWKQHPEVKLIYFADELATMHEQMAEGLK